MSRCSCLSSTSWLRKASRNPTPIRRTSTNSTPPSWLFFLSLDPSLEKLGELGNSLSCLVYMLDAIFCTPDEYREVVLSIFQRMGESLAYFYWTVSYLLVLSNGNEPELACWRVITPSEVSSAVQYNNTVPLQSTRLYNTFQFLNVVFLGWLERSESGDIC